MNILIIPSSTKDEDKRLSHLIAQELGEKGHSINGPVWKISEDQLKIFKAALADNDVFIFLFSDIVKESSDFYKEFLQISSYVRNVDNKIVYAVFLPTFSDNGFSGFPINAHKIDLIGQDSYYISKVAQEIDIKIQDLIGKNFAKRDKEEEIQRKIEKSAAEYLNPISTDLQTRETYLQSEATKWYNRGFIALLSGVIVAIVALIAGIILEKLFSSNYALVALFTIKGIVILALMIAASKYCFNLAKSFMNESLKVADRRHAISFGEFYLKVYDQKVEQSDLKDIFREWNISSGNSSFMQQSSNDHDPKVLEQVTKLIQTVRGK